MDESQWHIPSDELLSDKVANTLRTLIINQTLKPGSRLIQEEIAEKLGVSRMPLRDALKKLATEGLIELDPRRGASVVRMTKDLFMESYTLREVLEPLAIKISAHHLMAKDITELEDVIFRMDQCLLSEQYREFSDLNRRYHLILRSKSPWNHLNRFIDILWNGLPPYTPVFVEGQSERSQLEHKEILKALKNKEWEKLETTVRTHISRSKVSLLQHMEKVDYFSNNEK